MSIIQHGNERLKQIDGNDKYFVSDAGKLYSNAKGSLREIKIAMPGGHPTVHVTVKGKDVRYRIGELVAKAFSPNINGYNEISYIDGNLGNVVYTNLQWVDEAKPNTGRLEEIKGHKGYFISDCGKAYSKKSGKLEELKTHMSGGHLTLQIRKNRKQVQFYIKDLVGKSYIENPKKLSHIKCIDGNFSNVHYTNLQWVDENEAQEQVKLRQKQILIPDKIPDGFKQIEGYPLYYASKLGHIYSFRGRKFQKLKSRLVEGDYPSVSLHREGQEGGTDFRVHVLVATCFVPNENSQLFTQVDHKDSNPKNAHYENLQWVTQARNIQLAVERGRHKAPKKTVYQFDLSGNFIKTFESTKAASIEVGLASSSVIAQACKTGWKSAEFLWSYTDKIVEKHANRRIDQIDQKTNNVVASYINFAEAARGSKSDKGCIRKACKSGKPAKGYLWKFNETPKKQKELPEEVLTWRVNPEFPNYRISRDAEIYSIKMNRMKIWAKVPYMHANFINKDGKKIQKRIHIIVAETYCPNPLGLPEVNHINSDPKDPRADNLEWVDRVGNQQHSIKQGRRDHINNKAVYKVDLNGKVIAAYANQTIAAEEHNISVTAVSNSCQGKKSRAIKGFSFRYAPHVEK